MDESKEKALRRCHPDLRTSIRVADFRPSLHVHAGGFLNDVENDSIRKKKGRVKQVDELMDILVKKENKDFDYFCTVLEKEGYKVSSDKLKDAAGLGGQSTQSAKNRKMLRKRRSTNKTIEVSQSPSKRPLTGGPPSSPTLPSQSSEKHTQEPPLPTSFITSLEPMCELQVVSAVLHDNKVYITGLASASKDDKDEVPKDDTKRQVQVYLQCEKKRNWSTLPEAPNYNAPITVLNGRITLVGGRDANTTNITNILSTWHEEEHKWKTSDPSSMLTQRLESGVCHHDNLLLVVGGIVDDKEKKLVNTVDVYNFSSKIWSTPETLVLPIAQLRSPQVAVFKEYVYVIGGATTYPSPPTKGQAQYNLKAWRARWSDVKEAVSEAAVSKPSKCVWKKITTPPARRPTVVSCKDSMILVGGVKDGEPQKGIYEYIDGKNVDGTVGRWKPVGSMSVGRYRHAAVLLGSRGAALLVAGGYMEGDPKGEEIDEKSSSTELVVL